MADKILPQQGMTLAERAKALQAEAKAAEARRKKEPVDLSGLPIPAVPAPKPPEQGQLSLPFWADAVRGVPNSILRSALFGATKRGRRAYQLRVAKACMGQMTLLQSGPTLDQGDLDAWEYCIHLCRTGGLGCRIQLEARAFLRAIGRAGGGKNIEWLKGALTRLATSVVEIQDGKRAYFGPLIHHGTRDDETGRYVIEVNPAIVALYGGDGWSQVEWSERMSLKGLPLAQWLHGFYTTHAAPYPMKVETLHRLCGSEAKQMKHFRAELREALAHLETVAGWGWEIDDGDLVRISKKPTPSQVRHLIHQGGKKGKKPR